MSRCRIVNMQHPDEMSGAGTLGTTCYFWSIFGGFSKGGCSASPIYLVIFQEGFTPSFLLFIQGGVNFG